jgi:hypothetical protein
MPLGEPLRPRKEVFDYSRANESGGGTKAAAAAGGAYMKVYVRLRPNEGGTGAELSYSLPEQNKISIKENREPFPQEHQFTFHRIYERDAPQEVSIQKKKGVTCYMFSCFLLFYSRLTNPTFYFIVFPLSTTTFSIIILTTGGVSRRC